MDLVMHPVGYCNQSGCENVGTHAYTIGGLIAVLCEEHAHQASEEMHGDPLLTPLGRPPGQDVRRVARWLMRRRDDLPDSLAPAQKTLVRLILLRLAERLDRDDTEDTPVAAT